MKKVFLFVTLSLLFASCNYFTAGYYIGRGNVAEKKKKYDEAIVYYTKAIDLNPHYAEAYNYRALAYYHSGRYRQAIEDYTKAIERKPTLAIAYNNRGLAEHDYGLNSAAMADYETALMYNPNLQAAYNDRGELECDIANHTGDTNMYYTAMRDLNKALELNDSDFFAYCNRGVAKYRMGRYHEALADYNIALHINPEYATTYTNRGLVYARMERDSEARADYMKALSLRPNDASVFECLGLLEYQKGNYRTSISYYNRTIELDSTFWYAYYNRGLSETQVNETEKACEDLNIALLHHVRNAQDAINIHCGKVRL